MSWKDDNSSENDLFNQFKSSILNIDPVNFIERNLTLDGCPFRVNGNGYKPFADIYRYICLKAVERENTLPVLLVKGRQVGATTMAAALEAYFMACSLYGNNGRPPMRVMHLFPTLSLAAAYTKDKLTPIIQHSRPSDELKSNGVPKSFLEAKMDTSSPANDNMHFKKFLGGNQVWIESTGLTGDRIRGRQLCLDTDIPTPDRGFIKLRDLKQGDKLFDENGSVCNVTKLHPIQESPESYRVIFDDGTTIDACAEHLWLTHTRRDRINLSKKGYTKPKIRNTKELLETLKVSGESNHSIPTCLPVRNSKKDLDIDPYLLGLWLGDGEGFYNKHIPAAYMQSSIEQRLALLQGLMDADGCCGKDGRCEFVQCDDGKGLADDVQELIHSLGIKTSRYKKESGRCQDKHSIQFYTTLPVFKLNRKLQNLNIKLTKSSKRFIKSIEPIESKPMRCITVNSPSHLYLVTKSFIATHNTVDCLFFDEVQDMTAQAIGAADKIAVQGKYGEIGQGMKVLFGTPKQKGGAYWKMWQSSSQQYFHLHCKDCDQLFPLYRPDVDWEEIWLYGFTVKCTQCGHEQDKRHAAEKGKWIPLNKDEFDVKMHGYHINQLYIPFFSKEQIVAQKPENSPTNTEKIYMNEVLGEFFDGEGGTISKEEILANCLEPKAKFAQMITPSDNIRVYAGFDWGQKANLDTMAGKRKGQSYSCAVVLTAHGAESFSVDFATRLSRNDPQEKLDVVEEMFRRYSVQLAVGDVGDAGDLTHTLQRMYGDAFLGSRASANVNGHVKYRDDVFPKEIVFEKDYYISELFHLLKKGAIKFPQLSYDRVEWLIDHCCSMEVKITTDRSGDPVRRFVKGASPNDGFMALLNAYIAWKFDVTQKFNIKNPANMKHEIAQNQGGMGPIVGYCPNW